jgi:hypothetical protein
MNNKPMSTEYLEQYLLTLMLLIKPKKVESLIDACLGWAQENSIQSIRIQFGNYIEQFWNQVISDAKNATNLIAESNMIKVGLDERQIDHLFRYTVGEEVYQLYLESKCNLNFDSEKVKASNKKIKEVTEQLHFDFSGEFLGAYFCPVVDVVPHEWASKYAKQGTKVMGVSDMMEILDCPFTAEEYFTFLREVVGPILNEKRYA